MKRRSLRRIIATAVIGVTMAATGALTTPALSLHHVAGQNNILGNIELRPGKGVEYGSSDVLQSFAIDSFIGGCVGIGCDASLYPAFLNVHGEFLAGTIGKNDPCYLSIAEGPLRIHWADGSLSAGRLRYVFARPAPGLVPGTVTAIGRITWGRHAGEKAQFEFIGTFPRPCRPGTYPISGLGAIEHLGI